jgi:hypothetical protein
MKSQISITSSETNIHHDDQQQNATGIHTWRRLVVLAPEFIVGQRIIRYNCLCVGYRTKGKNFLCSCCAP